MCWVSFFFVGFWRFLEEGGIFEVGGFWKLVSKNILKLVSKNYFFYHACGVE